MAVALSADEQALLMQFLAEFRSLAPTHQIDICARIEQAVKPENEQEKSFFRALVRCLLDIAEGPGSTGPRALKARACVYTGPIGAAETGPGPPLHGVSGLVPGQRA